MKEKVFKTHLGEIHYWISSPRKQEIVTEYELTTEYEIVTEHELTTEHKATTLVFLPGLTADHRLFEKQIEFFKSRYNLFVWDAPGHAASYPFELSFSLADKAKWLNDILDFEGITDFIIVGQSMGGYVGQAYLELYPDKPRGFVSIDSAPLQRHYMTKAEIWLLKHTEGMYRAYPWKMLVRDGASGCAETEYGRKLMTDIMMTYDDNHDRYIKLVSHGYKILAEAMEKNLPYEIKCPAILICGEKDKAGSAKAYNKKWAEHTKLPIFWIAGAGHNSNTDDPDRVNMIIEDFLKDEIS